MDDDVIWRPERAAVEASSFHAFMAGLGLGDAPYEVQHAFSICHKSAFWGAVWDRCGVIGDRGDTVFVPAPDQGMLGARWFAQARLNFAENLLRGPDDAVAVFAADEDGHVTPHTMGTLRAEVARIAAGLRALGVAPGDRVGGILPNRFEALVALLAAAAIGAVWSSCSPDFGAPAILDRLGQVRPKVIIAAANYRYGGRGHDIAARLETICKDSQGLEHLVLVGDGEVAGDVATSRWERFGERGAPLRFERLAFDHPLYVLYTSGTTGRPKAIVHGAGGVLLQHLKEHQLHCDLRLGDVLGWYTNTAWMMYHWIVSGLASGAAIVLTDGAAIPKTSEGLDAGLLWRVMAETGATHFGVSPKYLHAVAEREFEPATLDLKSLRVLMSAGAPVAPEQFDWVYGSVGKNLMFASISGGTEIIGCFMMGAPTLPVRRGQLTCKALGHAVVVLDERNAPVVGRKGELCCTEPFPSMPLSFWGEDGDRRYRDTYFAQRPGIWTHGDLAELTIHGSGVIHGRTDTTLKPGGVRIGTAEIYAAVETFREIEDCLVFGAPREGDEEIVLCLKMGGGETLSPDLAARLRRTIRERASPRHVPHRLHAVPDIPYTLNGKRVEGAARAMLAGKAVKNRDSLANPECLEVFAALCPEDSL